MERCCGFRSPCNIYCQKEFPYRFVLEEAATPLSVIMICVYSTLCMYACMHVRMYVFMCACKIMYDMYDRV